MTKIKSQLLMYLPVLHSGYIALIRECKPGCDEVLLLGDGFSDLYPPLSKEIRSLTPVDAAAALGAIFPNLAVKIVTASSLVSSICADRVVIPDEDLLRAVVGAIPIAACAEIVWKRSFLRWDREWSKPSAFEGFEEEDQTVTDADRQVLRLAFTLADRSSDWWRQVGAILRCTDGRTIEAWNRHFPTEYAPYMDGDPRNLYRRGEDTDRSTALHAEASVIAQAARRGIVTEGSQIYVTTFPCPACARSIAEAGVAECFFSAPYGLLAGDKILRAAGVLLKRVELN